MRTIIVGSFLMLLSTAATALAQNDTTAERRFTLPDHGHLVIHVPRDWKDQLRQPPRRLPPTIVFRPTSGKPFEILMTTLWRPSKERALASRHQLRKLTEGSAQRAKQQAVEREIPVVEFQGQSGPGFYFSATDRAPEPDGYKFMTQGAVRVGELLVTFTILTNDGQTAVVRQALDALTGAEQARD